MEKMKLSDKQLIKDALIMMKKKDVDNFIKLISKFISQYSINNQEKENKDILMKETDVVQNKKTTQSLDSSINMKFYRRLKNSIIANVDDLRCKWNKNI